MTALHHRNRGLPFLHRNWLKATNYWSSNMGNKLSSPSSGDLSNPSDKLAEADHQSRRASKRRRIDSEYDGFPLFENYGDTQRALRVEVLKISHKDAPRVKNGILNGVVPPNVRDVVQIKARCKLTVSGRKGGELVVLHVDSQLCDIRVFKNPAGPSPMARFSSIRPFHIPEEKIFLERDDDAVFGLADCYSVLVELESAGDANWPPTDLVPISDEDTFYNRGLPSRQWVLTAYIADVFSSRNRKSARLRVKKQPHSDAATNFLMDMDVRWLTSISSQRKSREHSKDILPSISVVDPHEHTVPSVDGNLKRAAAVDGVNGVNGTNGHRHQFQVNGELETAVNGQANGSALETAEELAEGELTPGRSRRARQDINYNVKQMWNNAVGKETRKRRKLGDEQNQLDEHTITYLLPPEQVQTDKFACLLCGAENDRLAQLRAHYLSHPQYDFHFEFRPKAGFCVTVKPNARSHGSPLRPKVYQLGLPVKPLDLEKYVDGDDSWVISRLGPDDGREVFQETTTTPATRIKLTAKRARKKVLVPRTKQPLFDPLSKVQLQPGTPVPQHAIDDSWLLLKHRDNLQDFIDLEAQEKEYMQEWDAFILRKHISSTQYLPRNFLRFVREKASWIVAKQSRAVEFSYHVATLLARRVLPDAAIFEATQILNDARSRLAAADGQTEQQEPAQQPTRNKASGGCCAACGEPVPAAALLRCANKECKNRLYHDVCVENTGEAVAMGRHWKCKACS
ncbi:b480a7fe-3759-45c4-bb03-1b0c72cb2fef [Thermothielavioides terrestris]|uniref:B480a7fe-3759-45c4-bb03-1b0c72cb2fef n=1 Tax=Thermothielavioides terrestris TaxID=2587410 RepID=A0A446BYB2_9PEZI|nr:b480a7fe-3759-45c4-bb03-1b0c72cb2fef [Thermothielavioides terrestris]